MKKIAIILSLFCFTPTVLAEDVIRIEIGNEKQNISNSDLQRRVWMLERAVAQLQQRIFHLENDKIPTPAPGDKWVCTITAFNDSFSGTGVTKPVAELKAVEACKKGRGDAFFCKNAKCEK